MEETIDESEILSGISSALGGTDAIRIKVRLLWLYQTGISGCTCGSGDYPSKNGKKLE